MNSAEKWLTKAFCTQVETFAAFLPLHPNIFSFKESEYDILLLGNDLKQFFKPVHCKSCLSSILKRKVKSGKKGWQHTLLS